MRQLFAIVVALFLVMQTTVGLATPIDTCCLHDCTLPAPCAAPGCTVACTVGCQAPAVLDGWRMPFAEVTPAAVSVPPALPASGPTQEIWRPPD